MYTRRSVLGTTLAIGVGATAGCLDDLTDSSAGSLPAFADWLAAAPLKEGADFFVGQYDVQSVLEWPEELREDYGFGAIAEMFGFDLEDLDTAINAGIGMQSVDVFEGSFDPDEISDRLGIDEDPESYGDYDVYDLGHAQLAVSESAVVQGAQYEQFIDAHEGDADRIADEDETWDEALRAVGNSDFTWMLSGGEESGFGDLELSAAGITTSGDTFEGEIHYYFVDADAAADAVDEIEADQEESENEGQVDEWTLEVDGNVVIVEATGDLL